MLDWAKHQKLGTHTYEVFADCVEKAIAWSILQLGQNPKESQNRSENSLTAEIVGHLRNMGFTTEFDGTVGGHCDIIVKFGTLYQWLGEAKIYSSYKWLLKGYLQLVTRYSTGQENEDRGGMVIYFKTKDLPGTMLNWAKALSAYKGKSRKDITTVSATPPACAFLSTQPHKRTERDYRVKHFPVALHWDPEI
jgi:hypothetical protein